MSATTYTFTPENSYILNRLGANNGIAELDSSGKVPASQLPSYVDDVVEANTYDDFPITGESGKIYVDLSTNKTYRWGGSSYVEISESLALGETENTAYRGDRGKEAYDHAMAKGRGFSSGFYKVATNTEGHVTNVVPVAKSDIVNLGIPGDDFVGATADATGVHGYVPAPAVEDRNKFLSGNGTWKEAPGAKLIEVVLTPVSNESGAYTGTTRDFRITAGMKCIMLELGNPAAFKSNITVTAGAGIVTLTCASVEGESSATASFLKTAEDPTAITTSEFDYLENAKVDKAPTAIEGHFVSFNTVGNLIDSGYSANNVLIVPSGVTEGKVPQTNSNGEIVWTDLESVTVENSLTSTSTTNALSAAQGKALNDTKAPIDSPNFTGSISLGRIADTTVGAGSVAEGASVTASGSNSHAEGIGTTASGQSSHAEGSSTFASGLNSHAEGGGTIASGNSSHSEGVSTTASGSYSHAEGASTTASKNYSHAEGTGTTASGNGSHAEGGGTIAPGNYSHAEGRDTKANGDQSHAEGAGTTASGDHSHAEGDSTTASGQGSHAEGLSTRAYGRGSHAEGNNTIAAGSKSHVSGEYNVEDSYNNWPEWTANTSYEVGDKVKVTTGSGSSQTIEGYICKTANSDSTFTSSKWTDQFGKMNYAEIIGNGLYDSSRSNARALDWDGNEHLAGDLYVHCNADSTGGNKVATTTDLANKLDKPSNIPAGKFLQTDSSGNAVWGDAVSSTDVANAVTDWLDDNVPAGQTVVVDQSLTVSGAAADAKKTGDQLSDLKSAFVNIIDAVSLEWQQGYYDGSDGTHKPGDKFICTTNYVDTSTKKRLEIFCATPGNLSGIFVTLFNDSTFVGNITFSASNRDLKYIIYNVPTNVNKVYVNCLSTVNISIAFGNVFAVTVENENIITDYKLARSDEVNNAISAIQNERSYVEGFYNNFLPYIKQVSITGYTWGYYMGVDGNPHENSSCFYTDYIDVSEKHFLYIRFLYTSPHIITYYDSSKNVISGGVLDFNQAGIFRFVFPENVAYVIISFYKGEIPRLFVGIPRLYLPSDNLIEEYGYIQDGYIDGDSTRGTYNTFVRIQDNVNETNFIPCGGYYVLKIQTTGNADTQHTFYDSDMNIISGSYIPTSQQKQIIYIDIPSNASYIRFAYWVGDGATTTAKLIKHDPRIKGKKISFLGDSITTYQGWIPSGYAYFYPSGNVNSVSKTWWYELIKESGMVLLKNAAWSGSTISGSQSDTTGFVGSSDARINELKDGDVTPDIVCILIGINDFAKNNNILTGDYIGRSTLPTDSSKMMDAYAIALKKIHTQYPDAVVFIGTVLDENTTQFDMAEANPEFPIRNPNDSVKLGELNEMIMKLANAMDTHVIPMNECGITYWNASTYTIDGLHPSYKATDNMRMIAQRYITDYFCSDR